MDHLVKVVVPPAVEPLLVADIHEQANADPDVDDAGYVTMLIEDARQALDGPTGWLGRCLITQTLELTLDQFPGRKIELLYPPLQEVLSVKYTDAAGVEQTIDAADYKLVNASDNSNPYIVPAYGKNWPATRCEEAAVRVRYKAGYGDTGADVPGRILQYLKTHAATKYENREEVVVGTIVSPLPFVGRMLDNFRIR